MARYFFHVVDGSFLPDSVGQEFETLDEAHTAALAHGARVIGQRGERFWKGEDIRIVVTDLDGTAIFELGLSTKSYQQPAP